MNNPNPVRELSKPTRPPQTFEVEQGDTIKTNGFAFKVVPSKSLTTSMTRIPAFKQVDGSEKVVIWVCPDCGGMIKDEDISDVRASRQDCPFVACAGLMSDYVKEEV